MCTTMPDFDPARDAHVASTLPTKQLPQPSLEVSKLYFHLNIIFKVCLDLFSIMS